MPDGLSTLNVGGALEFAPGYVLVPTGALWAYVHASGAGALDRLPPGMNEPPLGFFTTVAAALSACRSARGDRVFCLPGHTESISSADYLSNLGSKTDIKVIGLGEGTNRPTFTWTVAGSTVLFDTANFGIHNCRMFWAGADAAGSALTVAAPITISAAGCTIKDCEIRAGFDADQIVTKGLQLTNGADYCTLENLTITWNTAAECTTMVELAGADNLLIRKVRICGATSSTSVGVARFIATAATQVEIEECTFINMKAASIQAVTGVASLQGWVRRTFFGILDDATLAAVGTPASLQFDNQCSVANLAGETGAVKTTVSA